MAEPDEGAAAFDFEFYNTYTSGDDALQREVLVLFFGQVDGLVADLDPKGSDDDWRAGAHAIKGGARGIGLTAIGDLCQDMEKMTGVGADLKGSSLADLKAALKTAKQSVSARYDGLFGA